MKFNQNLLNSFRGGLNKRYFTNVVKKKHKIV